MRVSLLLGAVALCVAANLIASAEAAKAPAPKSVAARPAPRTAAPRARRTVEPAQTKAAPAPAGPVPALASADFAWVSESTNFLPPDNGPGPVTSDKAHPYVPNNSPRQPSFRIADVANPILKPWAAEQMARANEEVLEGKIPFTARSRCWPAGVPAFLVFSGVRPVFFIQTPKEVLMIHEANQEIRHIAMNVPHSQHVKPSWYGESVGRYEGPNTLVVDTVGLSAKSFIDNYRTPHTDRLHVIERWTLSQDGKTLTVSFAVEDPGAFTTVWSAKQVFHRAEGAMIETRCAENNANYFHQEVYPIPVANTFDF